LEKDVRQGRSERGCPASNGQDITRGALAKENVKNLRKAKTD